MFKRIQPILSSAKYALADAAALNAAYMAACLLYAYLFRVAAPAFDVYLTSWGGITAGCAVLFAAIGVYRDMWSYITLMNLIRLAVACVAAAFWAYCFMRIVAGYWLSPIIPVNAFYLFLTFAVGYRALPPVVKNLRLRRFMRLRADRTPLLIVGAGEAASVLIHDIQNRGADSPYQIIGLIDDNAQKLSHTLRGVPVLGAVSDIPALVKKHAIGEIIVAIPSATTQQRRGIIAACSATGCKVRSMASVTRLSEATVANLHDLDITDLLGRPEVKLDEKRISGYLTDSVVLVTGGGGSIGSELCRQIMRFDPRKLVIFDFYENNAYDLLQRLRVMYKEKSERVEVRIGSVQDMERLSAVFKEFKPGVIFHAAAYKHVPLMEECPQLAIENNVFGTYNTAKCALDFGSKRFVLVSTDKAVNPTNVMGASKRIAELIVQSMNGRGTEFMAVRFGNVLGSNGSVVPIFRRQIEMGGPITVTHPDIIRYFMTIPEAAQLVLEAGAMAKGGETFVLDMGEPIKIVDLANAMIDIAGLTGEIDIAYTGLRPGEKLYEELLVPSEGALKTENAKIFIGKADAITEQQRKVMLTALQRCLARNEDVRRLIKRILPEYVNGN